VKLVVRRIGNSLGVIVPKPSLAAWGLGEGDQLDLTERGIHPAPRGGFSTGQLDEHRRRLAGAVVSRLELLEQTPVSEEMRQRIRAHIARDFAAAMPSWGSFSRFRRLS
jgi:hypothetical protein